MTELIVTFYNIANAPIKRQNFLNWTGLKPAIPAMEPPQTYALDRTVTGYGVCCWILLLRINTASNRRAVHQQAPNSCHDFVLLVCPFLIQETVTTLSRQTCAVKHNYPFGSSSFYLHLIIRWPFQAAHRGVHWWGGGANAATASGRRVWGGKVNNLNLKKKIDFLRLRDLKFFNQIKENLINNC